MIFRLSWIRIRIGNTDPDLDAVKLAKIYTFENKWLCNKAFWDRNRNRNFLTSGTGTGTGTVTC